MAAPLLLIIKYNKVRISVIMPVYNGSKFLNTSIPSVLAQSLRDFEFIVVDDCSKDDSRGILEGWAARDSRIRLYFNETNKGIFGTLNYLIELAKSNIVKIFCQDDVMMVNCLERQLFFMMTHSELAYSRCLGTQELSVGGARFGSIDPFKFLPEVIYAPASALAFFTFGNIPGNLTNLIIRKDLLLDSGGFSQKFPYAGDFEAWVRVAKKYPFGIQSEPLVYVHSHSEQGSVTLNRHNELIGQIDFIVTGLYDQLPQYLRRSARWHASLTYLIPYVSKTLRLFVRGKWGAVRLLFVPRRYCYSAWVGFLLYCITGGRRWGHRKVVRKFLGEIKLMNLK